MKKFALLSMFALLFSAFAYGQTLPCNNGPGSVNTFNLPCLFYGGDIDPNDPKVNGLANENDATVMSATAAVPYGAATYQNFVYQGGAIVGLFTNNFSSLAPSSGYWEIRSGVSEGNGGTLIASGTAEGGNFLQTATGRSNFGFTEYTDAVRFEDVSNNLKVNTTYWFAMVPVCTTCNGRSYNGGTFGVAGKIGTDINNLQFFNSPFFDANFTNANNEGTFPDFSSGVLTNVPEPGSLLLLGTSILGGIGVLRRKL